MDWCLYVDDLGNSSWVLIKHKDILNYINWPGHFYKLINGEIVPILFDTGKNWQDQLPE